MKINFDTFVKIKFFLLRVLIEIQAFIKKTYTFPTQMSLSNPAVDLLSETPGRVIVAVEASKVSQLTALASKYSIAISKLGTTGGDSLTINDSVS